MEVLAPDDDSPFLLGDIAPGDARLAVDTNMFRAGAASLTHSVPCCSHIQPPMCDWGKTTPRESNMEQEFGSLHLAFFWQKHRVIKNYHTFLDRAVTTLVNIGLCAR